MKKTLVFIITSILFLLGNSLTGKEKKIESKSSSSSIKDAKIRFDDVEIAGERKNPVNAFIISRNKAQLPRLIKLRKDFKDELSKSTDDL